MIDAPQPSFVDEKLYIAIDRRLVQGFHGFPAMPENFLDSQWPVLTAKNLFYRRLLISFAGRHSVLASCALMIIYSFGRDIANALAQNNDPPLERMRIQIIF